MRLVSLMTLKTELFPHQIEAVEKLKSIKIGALYMEQGTGKTRTALELIHYRLTQGKINKVLWLCPCNIKEDIKRGVDEHSEGLEGILNIHGIESVSQSDKMYLKLLDYVSTGDVYLIVDESNLVKNHFAKRTERIYQLSLSCKYKLILNGTPISKNEADLFAQWFILDKRILGYGSFWSFSANHLEYDEYGKPVRCLNVDYLSRKIAPYSYSIKKDECLSLPSKKYYTSYFNLTDEQKWHYNEIKDILLMNINEFDSTTIYRLFTALQQITSGRMVIYTHPLRSAPMFKDPLDNPRIKALLNNIDDEDEKTIIWVKFKHEAEDISQVLSKIYGKESIALFYGDIKQKERQSELLRFKNKAKFLIANKVCGGYGLNLQYCCNNIYYNNDFNWATRAQSEDRTHRIGQVNPVSICDICASNKVDERIMSNLWRKENLADSFKKELKKNNSLSAWIDGKDD